MLKKSEISDSLVFNNYKRRYRRYRSITRPITSYASYLCIFLFVFSDFVCLSITWNTVQSEAWYMITLFAVSCAVCLDVPLAIAGNALKGFHQGCKSRREMLYILIPSIVLFFLVFIFSFIFRLTTRNVTFQDVNTTTIINSVSETNSFVSGNSKSVLIAGLFSAILPLGTSIGSFVITYFTANPLNKQLIRVAKARMKLEDNIAELEQAIVEEGSLKNKYEFLIARENDLFGQYVEEVIAQEVIRKQAVREALMEKLRMPDDITKLTESGEKVNSFNQVGKLPSTETVEAVEKSCKDDEEIIDKPTKD